MSYLTIGKQCFVCATKIQSLKIVLEDENNLLIYALPGGIGMQLTHEISMENPLPGSS